MMAVAPAPGQQITAAGRYEVLTQTRNPVLQRAREVAKLTIPGLLPPEGADDATILPTPWQSIGADGVTNLAAQLLLVLFPPGTSFFRLQVDEFTKEQIAADEDAAAQIEAALAKIERSVIDHLEGSGARVILTEALQHLIVAGNGLVQVLKDGRLKFFPLSKYVVRRDLEGNVLEIITKETLARETLPPAAQALLTEAPDSQDTAKSSTIDLYTWVRRGTNGSWYVEQHVEGQRIPGTVGNYPKDKSAWIPLRWSSVSGRDYGRGLGEERLGDLTSVEGLRKAIVKISAAAAKVLFLRDPNSVMDLDELSAAESGDFVDGTAKDITVLVLDKMQDFSIAKQMYDEIKQSLDKAFLNASSVQRQAERVTAEEIRAMIGQLEKSLGGQYALLSEELQRPVVIREMHQLQASGKLPHLPAGIVSVKIVTGIEGLGRTSDLQRLDLFIAGAEQTFGPDIVKEYVNPGEYFRRRGTSLNVDPKGLVRTDDEVQQARQQAAQQNMTEKAMPGLMGLVQKGAEMGGSNGEPQSTS
jgi:hypothetical protein